MAANNVNTGLDEAVRQKLEYDPESGKIFFKAIGKGKRREAGYHRPNGYIDIDVSVSGTSNCLKAHRVAWFLHTGGWPEYYIDHINGNRSDNRLENLRDIDHALNTQNIETRGAESDNPTGVRVVGINQYKAEICISEKMVHLGMFETKPEAVAAYRVAKMLVHRGYLGR